MATNWLEELSELVAGTLQSVKSGVFGQRHHFQIPPVIVERVPVLVVDDFTLHQRTPKHRFSHDDVAMSDTPTLDVDTLATLRDSVLEFSPRDIESVGGSLLWSLGRSGQRHRFSHLCEMIRCAGITSHSRLVGLYSKVTHRSSDAVNVYIENFSNTLLRRARCVGGLNPFPVIQRWFHILHLSTRWLV